ncbi:hypothetical protein NQ315_014512 [Exocentrus adspersus]|uniref:Ribosomal protein S3 n=1 Tax=Exocentrus adspersus TaxID=1586481 RepID=A0AAV8V9L4_9CUCU|nr:hypothetical protein NQ315_014512 [Exocentrus adspersus]
MASEMAYQMGGSNLRPIQKCGCGCNIFGTSKPVKSGPLSLHQKKKTGEFQETFHSQPDHSKLRNDVEPFTYLGSTFSRKPNIGEEIEARIMAGNKCVAGLRRILKNQNISRQTKIRMYRTVIRVIVTYASETWALNKTEHIRLEVWERKILKKIFGGKRTEEGWIRRTNEEIKNLYGEAIIVSVIRAQRCIGHIERMINVRIPKMLMERTIGGKRRRGRPKAR